MNVIAAGLKGIINDLVRLGDRHMILLIDVSISNGDRSALMRLHHLAWECLHSLDWKDVPEVYRNVFGWTCAALATSDESDYTLLERLRLADMGILMGGSASMEFLNDVATTLHDRIIDADLLTKPQINAVGTAHRNCSISFPEVANLHSTIAPYEEDLSVQSFYEIYFLPQIPVVLKGLACRWPAVAKWRDPEFWVRTAGHRTVPVEVGEHYLSESHSSILIPIHKFFQQCIATGEIRGYLAQHALLDQIPLLLRDIAIPDHTCCELDGEGKAPSFTPSQHMPDSLPNYL